MLSSRRKTDGPICPLVKGPCLEHGCRFWVHLIGNNPQTGAPVDHHDCAVAWLPVLLIEGTQQTKQAGAAIESFRNEMVRQNSGLATIMAHSPKQIDARESR